MTQVSDVCTTSSAAIPLTWLVEDAILYSLFLGNLYQYLLQLESQSRLAAKELGIINALQ